MKSVELIAILLIACVLVILSAAFVLGWSQRLVNETSQAAIDEHAYVTWDTMEFDKAVAAWLIVRFIDKEAKFVFLPVGSQIREGVPFDVPQSPWKRQHKKSASDCVFESLEIDDPAAQKIVEIAHQIELDYWRYQQFPEAKKCQEDFLEIKSQTSNSQECLGKMLIYLDNLHEQFKSHDNSISKQPSRIDSGPFPHHPSPN